MKPNILNSSLVGLRLVIASFLIALSSFTVAFAGEETKNDQNDKLSHTHPCIALGEKKIVLYIGAEDKDGKQVFYGTAFLINYDNLTYVVTAKHVITALYEKYKDSEISYYHNTKDGKGHLIKQDWVMRRTNSKWIFSDKYDVAIMPYVLMDMIEFKTMPVELFVSSKELVELQEVFYISYQPGIETAGRITPIVRSGVISIVNDDETFILDAFVFPGNSGSPVFVKPSILIDKISISQNCKFVGVVGAYIPYKDVAISEQTKQPRIVFEENTGLAVIEPVQALQGIFKTDNFIQQHNKYKEQIKKFVQ